MIPSTSLVASSTSSTFQTAPPFSDRMAELGNRIYEVLASDRLIRTGLDLDTNSFFKEVIIAKVLGIRQSVLGSSDLFPGKTLAVSAKIHPDLKFDGYGKVSIRFKDRITYLTLPRIEPLEGSFKIVKYMIRISADGDHISLEMMSKIKRVKRTMERRIAYHEKALLLQTFSHPNILVPTDILIPSEKKGFELITTKCKTDLFVFFEVATDKFSSLFNFCDEACKFSYIEMLVRSNIRYMQEITSAMKYVYDKGYLHCDLKPENILLQKCPDGTLKTMLTDFDFLVRKDDHSRTMQGTRQYLPPTHLRFSLKNDLFSELYALGKIFHAGPSDLGSFTELLSGWEKYAGKKRDLRLFKAIQMLKEKICCLSAKLTDRKISDYTTVLNELDKAAIEFETDLVCAEC
jgi:serine/threonine protein kinase